MNPYWQYFKYVVRHKMYVFLACRRVGVGFWQAITHDLSKFLPDEFIPYARYFYGPKEQQNRYAFNVAWLKHLHRNPHHWQHWLLVNDSEPMGPLAIPEKYLLEMVADWEGAGRAINGKEDVAGWYAKNRDRQVMEKASRLFVDALIRRYYGGDIVDPRIQELFEE